MTPTDNTDTDDVTAADDSAATDPPATESAATDLADSDDGLDRRRLIRWIAVLAFTVPVIVEALTFGGLIGDTLLGGDDGSDDAGGGDGDGTVTESATPRASGVGVGDELLQDAPPTETIAVSEVRGQSADSRTYVLRVTVKNTTDESVELRLTGVTLRDGTTLASVSATGSIPAGETGEVTGAWDLPAGSMPVAVDIVLLRDGEEAITRSVPLERPPIRG
ncbi:hypothetical protein [Halobaculum gomorrense]|uniref:Uncharacterized protein n=1 Tax=Halobaculum gomorrense TaxID=43928 RepID=A0A1M5NYY7_9EURY|nr:hypothetical protein [Halobaculum gomorrense]SHG94193.1 hypothetical protein SAMN05443636_1380 [Halobaculum gomorrense]